MLQMLISHHRVHYRGRIDACMNSTPAGENVFSTKHCQEYSPNYHQQFPQPFEDTLFDVALAILVISINNASIQKLDIILLPDPTWTKHEYFYLRQPKRPGLI